MLRVAGETEVGIAAKLYEMRQFARRLGDEMYAERIVEWKRYLIQSAEEHELSMLEAFKRCAELLVEGGNESAQRHRNGVTTSRPKPRSERDDHEDR